MKKEKITILLICVLMSGFFIGKLIYNNYYKIDISPFEYIFLSRIVDSPDENYTIMVEIYKTTEDSDLAYIMGTLGTLETGKEYTDSKTIFWQKVNSNSIKEKTIDGLTLANWIDVNWLDNQTININEISLDINSVYDYRRD